MKNLLPILVLLLSFNYSNAQDSTLNSSITDLISPQNSRAIYKGKLLTGVNYSYGNFRIANQIQDLNVWSNGPSLNLGYGITKGWDIRISTGYSFVTSRHYIDGKDISGKADYWNGFTIGSKLNLLKQKGWIPELAVDVNVGFNYLSNNLNYGTTNIGLPWSYKLGKKFRLGGSFDFNLTSNTDNFRKVWDSFYYSVNVTYEIVKGVGVYGQVTLPKDLSYYAAVPKVGAYYRINPKMQVNLTFGKYFGSYSYPNSFENEYVSGGFSWLLGNK